MKVRISDHKIIYRFSDDELIQLKDFGFAFQEVMIGAEKLHFCIKGQTIDLPKLTLTAGKVHAYFPKDFLIDWIESGDTVAAVTFINEDDTETELVLERDLRPRRNQ